MRHPVGLCISAWIAVGVLSLAAFSSYPGTARAVTVSDLQGAWVTGSAACSDIFAKHNGRFEFKRNKRNLETSFIISGNQIKGARASCRIASEKRTADGLRAVLACSSQMMVGALPVTFRVPDPNTIVKFDPDFPEIETVFTRCN